MTQFILKAIAIFLVIGCLGCQPTQATVMADSPGAKIFQTQCVACHPGGGNIIRRGKNLKQRAMQQNGYDSVEAIAQIVTYGKNNMSAFGDRLTPDEIETVSAYVLEQAAVNWR
ncbi:MAG: c-type cytochrome [Jaaginema sp. PMC 1079.18]|nr:c-type cytochrome [Jaaginema sp. PMC 1080.18]MEC4852463.1 c-type cytochrome [Jaaginema sp. PMC 1079.18]MEC4867286.1 c-type cytochrome [Jaaginema sp. PMC 1078.18]